MRTRLLSAAMVSGLLWSMAPPAHAQQDNDPRRQRGTVGAAVSTVRKPRTKQESAAADLAQRRAAPQAAQQRAPMVVHKPTTKTQSSRSVGIQGSSKSLPVNKPRTKAKPRA